jgi:trans-L-3-hydroxyproline dehydratase
MIHRIQTIDAHAAGEPLRLITEGFPAPAGRTMLEKRAWVKKHADHLRKALMWEPRGHLDMYGALFTEPVTKGADVGVLFMHNEGLSTMCGHGIIAVVTIALERGLLPAYRHPGEIVLDSPAGPIRATPKISAARPGSSAPLATSDPDDDSGDTPQVAVRVQSVAFVNVPSFVSVAGLPVRVGTREVRVDVAFGGAFYAVVDSEKVGLPIDAAHLQELRRAGMLIKHAVESAVPIVHPTEPGLKGIYGTIFTGPPNHPDADLRNVTIFADAEVDRSPCGTGTCAVMAVLDAMALLPGDRPFVHESLIGTLFRGRVIGREMVGDLPAIRPELEGSAWITGEHTFLIDDDDPLRGGFKI